MFSNPVIPKAKNTPALTTALFDALSKRSVETLKLIDQASDAEINTVLLRQDHFSHTGLYLAANHPEQDVFSTLFNRASNHVFETIFAHAAHAKSYPNQWLRNYTILSSAARVQDSETFIAFINRIGAKNLNGLLTKMDAAKRTPLHFILRHQNLEAIQHMLKVASPFAITEALLSPDKVDGYIQKNSNLDANEKNTLTQALGDIYNFITQPAESIATKSQAFIAFIEERLPTIQNITEPKKWDYLFTMALDKLEKSNSNNTAAKDKLHAFIGRLNYGYYSARNNTPKKQPIQNAENKSEAIPQKKSIQESYEHLLRAYKAYLKINSADNINAEDNISAAEVLHFLQNMDFANPTLTDKLRCSIKRLEHLHHASSIEDGIILHNATAHALVETKEAGQDLFNKDNDELFKAAHKKLVAGYEKAPTIEAEANFHLKAFTGYLKTQNSMTAQPGFFSNPTQQTLATLHQALLLEDSPHKKVKLLEETLQNKQITDNLSTSCLEILTSLHKTMSVLRDFEVAVGLEASEIYRPS